MLIHSFFNDSYKARAIRPFNDDENVTRDERNFVHKKLRCCSWCANDLKMIFAGDVLKCEGCNHILIVLIKERRISDRRKSNVLLQIKSLKFNRD